MLNKKLPNATAVLVLGILSICFCAAWGIPGIVMGIVALTLYKKDKALYDSDPSSYEESFKNSNAGRVCAIIGLCLSALSFLFILVYFVILGTILGGVASTINEVSKHRNYNQYDHYYDDEEGDEEKLIDDNTELLDSNYYQNIEEEEFLNQDTLAVDVN